MSDAYSLTDLSGAFLGIEYLILDLDFGMWLAIQYDGQPGTTMVSLNKEPNQYRDALIDEYVEEHREDLTVDYRTCPNCRGSIYRSDHDHETCTNRKGTSRELCGTPLEVVPEQDETRIRGKAWDALIWKVPGLQARIAVLPWIIQNLYPGHYGAEPDDVCLQLDLVLSKLAEQIENHIRRSVGICIDALHLPAGGLLPKGATLEAKFDDYISKREKLTAGYNLLTGIARQYPEFKSDYKQHKVMRIFPPQLKLPAQAGGGDLPTPRFVVSLKGKLVELDGTRYSLDGDELLFVSALVRADGEWVTSKKLDMRGGRVKKLLPTEIHTLVESEGGKGHRIARANLYLPR